MKKTRLLASILSLTLGLTSFSAAPISISAETDEMSEVMTTTSAESEGLAPIIHDIDTAREKFEKYIEETDIDANIAEEGKYPQYEGKIVIECEPDTDAKAMIFKFADENMILHELFTTVMRFDTSKTVTYTVSFRFIDEETGENIENIHAKLYRYNNKLEPNEDNPGSYYIIRDNDVEPVLIAEWDSTETPVFTSEPITSYLSQYDYSVITDKLPEGYNFHGRDHVESGYGGTISDGDHEIYLKIRKGEPTPETVDIPLKGTFSLNVKVIDQNRNTPLKDMECEVFEKYSGKVVAKWNSSETEVKHIEGLEYEFEGNRIMKDFGKKIYQFRITNLPENYIYYGYQKDSLTLCGVYIDEFAEGNELSATAYLIDQSPDAPEIPYTTTAAAQVSTIVTTTTNLIEQSGDTEEDQEEFEIIFNKALTIQNGETKEFEYTIKGADSATFWTNIKGLSLENSFKDGKGVLIITADNAKTGFGDLFVMSENDGQQHSRLINIKPAAYDTCDFCGKEFLREDLIVGPIGTKACKECYDERGGHIGGTPALNVATTDLPENVFDGKGDANCDNRLDISDAVLIMQSIANPSKYKLTEQGRENADMDGDGITSGDALAIQKKLLKLD